MYILNKFLRIKKSYVFDSFYIIYVQYPYYINCDLKFYASREMKNFKILNKDFIKSQIYIFITVIILQLFFLVDPFIYKKIIDETVLKNDLNLFFKYIFIYLIFALIKLLLEYLSFICETHFQNKNYLILNNIFL